MSRSFKLAILLGVCSVFVICIAAFGRSHQKEEAKVESHSASGSISSGLGVDVAHPGSLSSSDSYLQSEDNAVIRSKSQTTNSDTKSSTSTPSSHFDFSPYLNYQPASTGMPNYAESRPSPTFQVPPSPNCGANTDSSYYGNCVDVYCSNYPDSLYCLDR
jgi:hypothetical protein